MSDTAAVTWHDPRFDEQIRAALGRVYDPCSLAANNALSLIDMGLVREWRVDEHANVHVTMCVTAPSCLMAPKFLEAARQELRKIEGIGSVEVEVDPTIMWTPDLMTATGKRLDRMRHARARRLGGVRPQQWRETERAAG